MPSVPTLCRSLLLLSGLLLLPSAWAAPQEDGQRLQRIVAAHLQNGSPQEEIEIRTPTLERKLRLNRCPSRPEAFDPPGTRPGNRRTVGLRCPGEWTLYVPTQMERRVPMLVLARPIAPGETLTAAHLRRSMQSVDSVPLGYLDEFTQAVGAIARQPLAEGTVLRPSHLRAGNAVERGQPVRLIVERAGLRIESSGEALGNGAVGGWVAARNLGSGRVVEGRIQSPGVVQIP